MFIGHYGIAFAAKAAAPDIPLPVLMISTQIIDILFCGLVAAKVERVEIDKTASATVPLRSISMPYSHSGESAVVISLLTAVLAGVLYPALTLAELWIIGLVCLSHWVIDVIMHPPDIPILSARRKIGLGVWNNRPLSIGLELGLIAAGTAILATSGTVAAGPVWTVGAVMIVLQAVAFTTPPPAPVTRMLGGMMLVYCLATGGSIWIEATT